MKIDSFDDNAFYIIGVEGGGLTALVSYIHST